MIRGRIVTCLALLLVAVAAPAARAQTGHRGIDNYFAAADAFDRLAAGGPPRLTDPAAAALLRRLSDREATFGVDAYTQADLPALGRLLMRSMSIPAYYLQLNIAAGAPRAVYRPQQDRNSTEYQGEMIPVTAFAIDALAVTERTLNQALAGLEPGSLSAEQRAGLLRAREGAGGTILSMLDLSIYPGIRPASGVALATALARNAETLAATITPAQRQAVLTRARRVRAALSSARAELDLLITAMSATACTGLCAI